MSNKEEKVQEQNALKDENKDCGIVMPISEINGCTAEHWKEVKKFYLKRLHPQDIQLI